MTRLISLLIAAISFVGTIGNAATAEYERDFLEKRCGGRKACENELAVPVSEPDILTFAEQFVIQKYTESNRIEDETIMLDAASKIPVSELTAYRGGSQSWAGIKSKGDVITISRITSISADQTVAENFVKDQLLIFHTRSAHSIAKYSVTGEQELLLLPGVRFQVSDISYEKIDLSYGEGEEASGGPKLIRVVELTEFR